MVLEKWKDLSATAQMFVAIGTICAAAFTLGGAASGLSHYRSELRETVELNKNATITNSRKIDKLESRVDSLVSGQDNISAKLDLTNCILVKEARGESAHSCLQGEDQR